MGKFSSYRAHKQLLVNANGEAKTDLFVRVAIFGKADVLYHLPTVSSTACRLRILPYLSPIWRWHNIHYLLSTIGEIQTHHTFMGLQ